MEILGIGPMELILILIVALMVFGPDKLPQIGAKLGRAMRDMRRATRAISEEINATRAAIEAPARELAEPFQEVKDAAKAVGGVAIAARNPGQALRDSVMRELNTPVQTEAAVATPAAPETTIVPQAGEENVIDPLTETGAAVGWESIPSESGETVAALPAPDAPHPELPAPDAASDPGAAASSIELGETSQRPMVDSSANDEHREPPAAPESLAPTPPEQ